MLLQLVKQVIRNRGQVAEKIAEVLGRPYAGPELMAAPRQDAPTQCRARADEITDDMAALASAGPAR